MYAGCPGHKAPSRELYTFWARQARTTVSFSRDISLVVLPILTVCAVRELIIGRSFRILAGRAVGAVRRRDGFTIFVVLARSTINT